MKSYVKDFCKRGMLFAWAGPVVLTIVWGFLQVKGVVNSLSVNQAVLGILSTTVMAFVAAGVSIVYQIESLPKAFAGLIQMAVLYMDYLGFYLLNGWLSVNHIWIFTVIFIVGFFYIWLFIYLSIRMEVSQMNQAQNTKE